MPDSCYLKVADYSYDELDRVKAKLENSQTGNQLYLTTYRWDREGNKLEELRYNHGQTTNGSNDKWLEEVVEETLPDAGKNVPNGNAWGWWKKHGNNGNGNNGNNGNNNGGSGTEESTPVPGTYQYEYDAAYRLIWTMEPNKVETNYTYDSLGNLVLEENKFDVIQYRYNDLNQIVSKTIKKDTWTYSYDDRGNRVQDSGKQVNTRYTYDATNRMVQGRTQKGATSSYEYNGLGVRVNNTQVSHSNKATSVDYVNDYTSVGYDELMLYSRGQGQDSFDQRMVYGAGQRVGQFTDRAPGNNGNGGKERMLYVHEDVTGSVQFFSKQNGKNFSELEYDPYGMPDSPSKLLQNNNGNYVAARYTNHEFDTTLGVYFANARFYDALNRQWMADDPIKDGLNWYQYCLSNPASWVDPWGLMRIVSGDGTDSPFAQQIVEVQTWLERLGYLDMMDYGTGKVAEKGVFGGKSYGAFNLFMYNYTNHYGYQSITDELYLMIANQYINRVYANDPYVERMQIYNAILDNLKQANLKEGIEKSYYRPFYSVALPKKISLSTKMKSLGVKLRTDYNSVDKIIYWDLTTLIEKMLEENRKKASGLSAGDFYDLVNNDGDWDIKRRPQFQTVVGIDYIHMHVDFYWDEWKINAEELGNITFGFWGTEVGFSRTALIGGGAWANFTSGGFDLFKIFNGYFGDSEHDGQMVERGINLHNERYS